MRRMWLDHLRCCECRIGPLLNFRHWIDTHPTVVCTYKVRLLASYMGTHFCYSGRCVGGGLRQPPFKGFRQYNAFPGPLQHQLKPPESMWFCMFLTRVHFMSPRYSPPSWKPWLFSRMGNGVVSWWTKELVSKADSERVTPRVGILHHWARPTALLAATPLSTSACPAVTTAPLVWCCRLGGVGHHRRGAVRVCAADVLHCVLGKSGKRCQNDEFFVRLFVPLVDGGRRYAHLLAPVQSRWKWCPSSAVPACGPTPDLTKIEPCRFCDRDSTALEQPLEGFHRATCATRRGRGCSKWPKPQPNPRNFASHPQALTAKRKKPDSLPQGHIVCSVARVVWVSDTEDRP